MEDLVRAQCELPGYMTLNELTKKIRTEVNRAFFTLVAGRVDAVARARLARMMVVAGHLEPSHPGPGRFLLRG
ncbi:hypothetical protein [Microtetraspora malaysiensis]|uniref:hypothetical protein n=1 Tax=Microtetraspora malaysiensis TaxID=161358 RepID=UPI003D930286